MECYKCGKLFKSKQNLQFHLDKKVKCDRVLECDNCKVIFQTKYKLDRHLNNKIKCLKITPDIELISAKKEIIELKKELLDTKKENIEYKLENNKLKQTLNNCMVNTNNGVVNINNGTINNINIFGSESIEHITKKILEREILKIAEKQYDECHNKIMSLHGLRYRGTSFIKMIDIHVLMTKLIYFTKKKNRTMKKENDKYYINSEDGWEETNLEQLHIKTLTKHQEVLVQCESIILKNPMFRKVIEFYFDNDENKLIVEVGKIEFILSKSRLDILNKTLDIELYNMDKLDKLIINHSDNIVDNNTK